MKLTAVQSMNRLNTGKNMFSFLMNFVINDKIKDIKQNTQYNFSDRYPEDITNSYTESAHR
jgi:hypothetical protein